MKRTMSLSLALVFVLSMFSEAMALDGWRDRKGIYYGVSLGGASSKADTPGAKSHLGYTFGARLGGGVDKRLTLDGSVGLRIESYDENGIDVSTRTANFYVGANYFLHKGLYIRLQGGLAQFSAEVGQTETDETGVGFGGGLGYEFFASSDLAIGVGGEYQMQRFDEFNLNILHFGITATWY